MVPHDRRLPSLRVGWECPDRDVTVVLLSGELDMAEVAHLRESVDPWAGIRGQKVSIDLSGLTFIDCAGLHGLIDLVRSGSAAGSEVRCLNPSPIVQRLFELTGLNGNLGGGVEPS